MDTLLRQRVPFRASEGDEQEDSRVLDEQEQEVIIENLRAANDQSTSYHLKFLQGCFSFTILFHIWFLITPRQVTPLHVLLPSKTPRPPLIPFATGFTFLNIFNLLNAMLHLPKELSFPRLIHSVISRITPYLPLPAQRTLKVYIPVPMKWIAGSMSIPPLVSLMTVSDLHQILWWTSPLIVVGIFLLVTSWIQESQLEIERLNSLKYKAKGV